MSRHARLVAIAALLVALSVVVVGRATIWRPLSAASPHPPLHAPDCTAAALRLAATWRRQGAEVEGVVTMTPRLHPCALVAGPGATPVVTLLDARGRRLTQTPRMFQGLLLYTTVLTDDYPGQIRFHWINWCYPAPTKATIITHIDALTLRVPTAGIVVPSCSSPARPSLIYAGELHSSDSFPSSL